MCETHGESYNYWQDFLWTGGQDPHTPNKLCLSSRNASVINAFVGNIVLVQKQLQSNEIVVRSKCVLIV